MLKKMINLAANLSRGAKEMSPGHFCTLFMGAGMLAVCKVLMLEPNVIGPAGYEDLVSLLGGLGFVAVGGLVVITLSLIARIGAAHRVLDRSAN